MAELPRFTVIMATFNRGRHILPSIRSVLQQDLSDFELLVIGDHCTDETGSLVEAMGDPRVRWINLPQNGGSQSFPNNEGIRQARGRCIAYLGHDDIWERDHLSALAAIFESRPEVGFAVSGGIFYMPNGIPGSWVTGLFDNDDAKHRHFFPPSTFAHRRNVPERIGLWADPMEIRPPVDCDFLIRAGNAGFLFASTMRVTVHKFASGQRYLSYLRHESREQEEMLSAMDRPGHRAMVKQVIEQAKQLGVYMHVTYPDFSLMAAGATVLEARKARGIMRPQVQELADTVTVPQLHSNCGLDWEHAPEKGIRWQTKNPRPRMLFPVTAKEPVHLRFEAYHADRAALRRLQIEFNGKAFSLRPVKIKKFENRQMAEFEFVADLLPVEPSIIEFILEKDQVTAARRRGIGIGNMQAEQMARSKSNRSFFARLGKWTGLFASVEPDFHRLQPQDEGNEKRTAQSSSD